MDDLTRPRRGADIEKTDTQPPGHLHGRGRPITKTQGFSECGGGHIRAGRVHAHRRRMLSAAGLVGLFLVSYLFKVAFVGRALNALP